MKILFEDFDGKIKSEDTPCVTLNECGFAYYVGDPKTDGHSVYVKFGEYKYVTIKE